MELLTGYVLANCFLFQPLIGYSSPHSEWVYCPEFDMPCVEETYYRFRDGVYECRTDGEWLPQCD